MNKSRLPICLMLMLLCFSQLSRGKPAPGLTITGPVTACVGNTSTYSVNAIAGDTYRWSVTADGVLTSVNPSNPAYVSWVTAGTAVVKVVEYSGSLAIDSTTLTVTVYLPPVAYITAFSMVACQNLDSLAKDTSQGHSEFPEPLILSNADGCIMVCDSSYVQYMAHGPTGSHFQWYASGGAIIGSSTAPSIIVRWGAPGGGSLTLVDTGAGGCVTTVTICFTIIQRPIASFAILPEGGPAATYSGCAGATLVFQDLSTADLGSPIVSWLWSFGDGAYSSTENPTHPYPTPGTYPVYLVVTNACGCSDTFTTSVTINQLSGPDIECPHEVCANDTSSFSTSVSCPGAIYDWSVIGGTIIAGAGTQSITVQWTGGADGYGYVSLAVYLQGSFTFFQ